MVQHGLSCGESTSSMDAGSNRIATYTGNYTLPFNPKKAGVPGLSRRLCRLALIGRHPFAPNKGRNNRLLCLTIPLST